MASLYETDFYAWTQEQARKLRAGEGVDAANIAEELETLGRSEEQQLTNRLAVLNEYFSFLSDLVERAEQALL